MIKKQLTFLIFIVFTISVFSQTGKIEGTITDNNGASLLGVNTIVKNTTKGAQTDIDGSFQIDNLQNGTYTLLISYLGYKTKELSVTLNNSADAGTIILFEGNELLQEVVIDTDRKNKFSRKQSAYVSKMPLKNLENSQVYNTITNQLIVSQSTVTLDDALKNATGISKLWNSTGRSNDGAAYFSSRGFAVQPQLVNGIAGFTNSFINASNIERLEVIKGPSGTLFGGSVAGYGGLINIVTKKPYNGTGGSVSVSYGSYNFNSLNADVNISTPNEKASLRFNAGYQNEDSFQDAGFKNSVFVAPSLTYKVNKDLTLNIAYEANDTEQTNGTSIFLNRYVPLHFSSLDELNYDPEISFANNDVTIDNINQNYRGEIAWKISDNWNSQTIIGGSNSKSKGYYTYLWDYADWIEISPDVWVPNNSNEFFSLNAQKLDSKTKALNLQQNFTGEFKIGDFNNKLLAGVDYLNKKIIDKSSPWVYSHAFAIDGSLPFADYGETDVSVEKIEALIPAALALGSVYNDSEIHQNILGAYISDVFEFSPKLSVMASLRYDRFDYGGDVNTDADNEQEYVDNTLSPKFGVVFQPIVNRVSVFANYQNGFSYKTPEYVFNNLTSENELVVYDVIEANQLEFGVKGNLFNNKLEGTLSFYNIDIDNIFYYSTYTQDQKVNSKGVELEINASPIDGLNIHGGVSYNKSEITDFPSNTTYEGLRYHESGPETSYNFWADYKFVEGALKNFGLGAGFNGASEYNTMVGYQPTTGSFMLPGYTVFNAAVYYEHEKFRVSVKGNNLSDQQYYTGWSTITPEQPRMILGTVTYKF